MLSLFKIDYAPFVSHVVLVKDKKAGRNLKILLFNLLCNIQRKIKYSETIKQFIHFQILHSFN